MMHTRSLIPTTLRFLFLCTGAWALSGCSMAAKESFTLQAEMPKNFTLSATSFYKSTSGEECSGHEVIKSEPANDGRLVEINLPLSNTARGCSMELQNVKLNIQGRWGNRDLDIDSGYGGLSIRDEPTKSTSSLASMKPPVFKGQCQWLFRTMGPDRVIAKILKCRAVDSNDSVKKNLIGGALQRTQLAGKTVRLVLTEANTERPYYKGWWLETPKGWKACTGLWGTNNEEPCEKPYKFIKSFKMPDGRDCSVYPNCTE